MTSRRRPQASQDATRDGGSRVGATANEGHWSPAAAGSAFSSSHPYPAASLPTGTSLGPYRLISELGAGGMGRVYLAEATSTTAGLAGGTRVAIKVIHPFLLDSPDRIERFRREARAGIAIQHPNVVRTYAVGEQSLADDSCQYLVMEYVAGQSLKAMLSEIGRLPEGLCMHVGREIARGLAAIHAAGMVHRDIKPENILITSDETVKVADLGVVRVSDATVELSSTGEFLGSIRYAAPEQFMQSSHHVDARADLYSLGTVLFELATGQHPFSGGDVHSLVRQVVEEVAPLARQRCSQLSPFFEQAVATLLAKQPAGRFETARELLDVLSAGEIGSWWIDRTHILRAVSKRSFRRLSVLPGSGLHGRTTELNRLLNLYADAKAGHGRLVLIEGETGIGKTRLIDELVARLEETGEDVTCLFGSYPPGSDGTAAGPYARAIRDYLGDHGLEEAAQRYLRAVPRLVPGFVHCLAGDAGPGAESLSREALTTAFVRFLQALAVERPTVLVIEDLHSATEEGKALFAALGYEVDRHRLLLIGTSRSAAEDRTLSHLARHEHCSRLALPRLESQAVIGLLGDAMGSETVADILAGPILAASDGNPYFVLEFARQLREQGVVHRGPDGQWVMEKSAGDLALPASLQDLMHARLSGLDPADRELLELASCCGYEFDPTLVVEAAGRGIMAGLRSLALIERRDGLVRAIGRRYVFDHHLVQSILYGELPPQLRESCHAAIAEALEHREHIHEQGFRVTQGTALPELCEHFLRGGLPARALPYLSPALDCLEQSQMKTPAGELARQALAAPGMITGRDRVRLLLRGATWATLQYHSETVLQMINEALELATKSGDPGDIARALVRRGATLDASGREQEGDQDLRRAIDIASEIDDKALLAEAWSLRGSVLRQMGRAEESLALHEKAIPLTRELQKPRDTMRLSLAMANSLLDLGREEEALAIHKDCVEQARALGEVAFEALELGNVGSSLFALGRFAEAKQFQEQHLALARAVGYRRGEMFASANLGITARALGHLAEARICHERTHLIAKALGDLMGEAIACLQMGIDDLVLGELDRGLSAVHSALALGDETKGQGITAEAACTEGALLRLSSRIPEAEEAVRKGLARYRAIRHPQGISAALLELGRLLASTGQRAEAEATFREVCEQSNRPAASDNLVARARLAALGKDDYAPVIAATDAVESSLARSEAIEIRYCLWQSSGDVGQLRAAHRMLVDLEDHAPAASRQCLIDRIPIHREIRRACAGDHGTEPAERSSAPGP